MFLSKNSFLRCVLLVCCLSVWLAAGLYLTNAVTDLIHFISLPLLISYLLIFRPTVIRRKFIACCVFCIFIALLTAGYLIALSRSVACVKINLLELPIAVYFLLSVYVILWSMDKLISLIVSIIPPTIAKTVIKTTLRFACLTFVAIPYLAVVFTTHWVKFSGTTDLENLSKTEYQRACFISEDGTKLAGWFIPSAGRVSDSSVIIAPGRTPTKNLFLPYAKILRDNGYNILLFDLRGNGDSSGHKYSFGINETDDILSAVNYLRDNYPESSRYIYGFGINEGAHALIAAAGKDRCFAAVVIDNASGYEISLPVWLSDYMPGWMKKTLSKVTKSLIFLDVGQFTGDKKDIYEKIAQISPCSVLVSNSLETDQSAVRQTLELYTRAKKPKMLWLASPQKDGDKNIGFENEYFQNILKLFDFGRAEQQPDYRRNGHLTAPVVQHRQRFLAPEAESNRRHLPAVL